MNIARHVDTGDVADAPAQSVAPVVAAWAVAGGCALAGVVATAGAPALDVTWLILVVLVAAAETALVQLRAGSTGLSLSLLEVFVAVALLLLEPSAAVTAIITGIAISHTIRRLSLPKRLFNVGQHAVAATAGAALVALPPATPAISSARMAAVIAAVMIYGRINAFALAGIFSRLRLVSVTEQITRRPGFLLATSLGNASVGAIAVTLWTTVPHVLWIIVGPVVALYLSYGSSFRIESLLTEARTERDHLDRVVSGVQEGIVLLDAAGIVRLWNTAMVRITGLTPADAVGRPAREVLCGTDADGSVTDPSQVLRDRLESASYTAALTDAAGERVDTRVSHTLVYDERGRLVGDVVLVQDLSREREAHALKEDFVARVSHELRTPLSPLRGYAQLLLSSGDRVSPEKRDHMLTVMVERVGHLERLIEDLLLVSRVASGELNPDDEVTLELTDVEAVTRRMCDWVARAHPERDVRVGVADGGNEPAWADPLRVGQVVTNLVSNACKYATAGTPVDVTVSPCSDGGIRVTVRDQGPGIPDDKLETIFDRFQRLEDPQRMKTGGLGLGLYIARHLAAAMGGQLTVDSRRGAGTTFTLTLPPVPATVDRTTPPADVACAVPNSPPRVA